MRKDKRTQIQDYKRGVDFIETQLSAALHLDYDDPLRMEYATTIAIKLRALLYDHPKRGGNSLLTQLGFKEDVFFFSYPGGIENIVNMLCTCSLLDYLVRDNCIFLKPKDFKKEKCILYSFKEWWTEVVIDSKHDSQSHISRRDIVLVLADKEGGAHYDPDYDDCYLRMRKTSSFILVDAKGKEQFIRNDYYVESLFYIAQEFVASMRLSFNIETSCIRSGYPIKVLKYSYYRNDKSWDSRSSYVLLDESLHGILYTFDYYQKALYELKDIYQYECKLKDGSEEKYWLIHSKSNCEQLVYLRSEKGPIGILIKRKNAYKELRSIEDLVSDDGFTTLEQYKMDFAPRNPKSFDYWLDRQWIERP